jgi:hypothetical protein
MEYTGEGKSNAAFVAAKVGARKLSLPALLKQWERPIDPKTQFGARNALSFEMAERGTSPDAWIAQREEEAGVYPSVEDAEFSAKLMRKTEFLDLASRAPGDSSRCGESDKFEQTPIQRLIARFLHPTTPYKGVLLNHGVGVGKTCTAVGIAEMYLDAMPHKSVIILAPKAIADGFHKTIFNVEKLVENTKEQRQLTGERWASPQCTGMTYLRLAGMANHPDLNEIEKEVDKWIKRRYQIVGYLKFYNWVQEQLEAEIPPHYTEAQKMETRKSVLLRLFSDRLLIVDEAHNLRDVGKEEIEDETKPGKVSDAAGGRKITPVLRDIAFYAEGLKLVLMTATPMYDTAPEIILLLNLLLLNDQKREEGLLTLRDCFPDGDLTEDATQLARFTTILKRYVSYMRGENPATFPLRLTPMEANIGAFLPHYPVENTISKDRGADIMGTADRAIFAALPLLVHPLDPKSPVAVTLGATLSAR